MINYNRYATVCVAHSLCIEVKWTRLCNVYEQAKLVSYFKSPYNPMQDAENILQMTSESLQGCTYVLNHNG